MADTKEVKVKITDGPPRDAFIAALFFHSEKTPFQVTFTLEPTEDEPDGCGINNYWRPQVVITGADRELGCEHGWNFRGRIWHTGREFTCNYDTRSRTGYFITK